MNITNTIWRNCYAHPDRVALLYEGHPASYGALRLRAELASARLAAAGVTRGDVVALSIRNRLSYLTVLLAVTRLGAVATPLWNGLPAEYREELVAANRVRTIVLDKDESWRSSSLPASCYLEASMLLAPPATDERLEVPPVAQGLDEQPWLIALSSGTTTGKPKRNPQNHARGALLASLSPRANQDDQERVFLFTSLGIEYGISTVMRQLYRGATTVLTQSIKPEGFYATVQRDQPTRVVTTTANATLLWAHAAKTLPESLTACASLKSIMVAGGFVSKALRDGITHRICSRLEVDYGATETGSLAFSTPETHAVRPGSTGRLNSWVQAEAVDENDHPLPPGQQGILRFKSLLLTNGYLDDEQATEQAFRNGWFYPGDSGSVGTAGYLFLNGRIDHMLNLGGNKINPDLIEKLLDEQPEIIESAVVVVKRHTGKLALVAAVEAQAPVDSAALKRLCQERLGKMYRPHAIVQFDALPRNESGKVMRLALAARIKFPSEEIRQ
ncbi:MAG: hypothetical protein A2521_04200 [Deltaproteobacteria bacterium RIFOXYD12_FULL_57_12]|nr:MAG: hypothetical protein A2521_04200 [Deltaproteobacteria bacterium RIFOXYD12_FULL_57_12]